MYLFFIECNGTRLDSWKSCILEHNLSYENQKATNKETKEQISNQQTSDYVMTQQKYNNSSNSNINSKVNKKILKTLNNL